MDYLKNYLFNHYTKLLVVAVIFSFAFALSAGPAMADEVDTPADKVDYYTVNDGSDFLRSEDPMNISEGNLGKDGVIKQEVTDNGGIRLIIENATGYTDTGFYFDVGKLGDLDRVETQGDVEVNMYFDKNDDGEYFEWDDDDSDGYTQYKSVGDDAYGGIKANDNVVDNDSEVSIWEGGSDGTYTLSQLKEGDADGISSTTNVAIWIGFNIDDEDREAEVTSIDENGPLYVNEDWSDKSDDEIVDGHVYGKNAFSSVQSAVDAATEGDTIKVKSGTYEESVIISKSDLKLVSAEEYEAIIEGTVDIEADGVRVEGFQIEDNEADIVVEFSDTSGTEIINNKVSIDISEDSQAKLAIGEWTGPVGAGKTKVIDNEVTGGIGMYLDDGSEAIVEGNTVIEAVDEGIWIVPDENNHVSLKNNEVENYDLGNNGKEAMKITAVPAEVNGEEVDTALETANKVLKANSETESIEVAGTSYNRDIKNVDTKTYYSSIQDAVDDAEEDDTIEIAPGTYEESFTIDKNITLASTEGPEETVINGTMTVDTSEEVEVVGLTFEKNYHEENAIILEGGNDVILKNLILKDTNEGYWSRGILTKADNTQLTVNNSEFIDFSIGIYGRANSLTVEDTVMSGIGEVGIGLAAGELTVKNSEISVNGSAGSDLDIASVRHGPDTYGSEDGLLVENSNLYSEGDVEGYHSVLARTTDSGHYTEDQINRVKYSTLGGKVSAQDGRTIDATQNYWGAADGPSDQGHGSGASVSADVSYSPWYKTDSMTEFSFETTESDDGEKQATIAAASTISDESGENSVELEENTQITGSSDWDGVFNVPTVTTEVSGTKPSFSGKDTETKQIVTVGSATGRLELSVPAKLTIPKGGGDRVGWTRDGEDFHEITTECGESFNDASSADAFLDEEGVDECKIDDSDNDNFIIWTNHFTDFVTFTATDTETDSGGGGGGVIPSNPPSISNIETDVDATEAEVTWETDKGSLTWIEYGESEDYDSEVKTEDYGTSHSVTLEDLSPDTTYHYKVRSEGEEERGSEYTDRTFTTSAPEEETSEEEDKEEAPKKGKSEEKQGAEKRVLGEKVVNERAQLLNQILDDAGVISQGDVSQVLENVGQERDLEKEVSVAKEYVEPLTRGLPEAAQANRNAVTNFVAYGTPSTLDLGAGERAGVISSCKSAFGKLPNKESEWQDALKIANGRWPSERSQEAEDKAEEMFEEVYKKEANMENANDNAAVTIMAYGLRSDNRNTDSEAAAIEIFKSIYGQLPDEAEEWDTVRAIAYSGATR